MKNPCKTKWQKKWLDLDVVSPAIQELATEAESFCGKWMDNNVEKSLLIIVGNYGSGKTHTAKRIFKFCMAASMNAYDSGKWGRYRVPTSVFIPWPEATTAFANKEFGLVGDALDADLTILDDVGAENDPWKVSTDRLCQILSRRETKFTVLTTNVASAHWNEKFDGRINDRLFRNSVIVDLTDVPSYAQTHF